MTVPGSEATVTLSIRQKKFGPEGFASTVRAPTLAAVILKSGTLDTFQLA
jgi:hypothetical protein